MLGEEERIAASLGGAYGVCPICGCLHDDGMPTREFGFFCMDCADRLPPNWRELDIDAMKATVEANKAAETA